jgi:hypothetical protein
MNNPPAFPHTVEYKGSDCGGIVPHGGMTLRDYFAAQALTGAQIWDAVINGQNAQFSQGTEKLAEVAYAVADAMLKAREA